MPHPQTQLGEKIRTMTVPGQTLERDKASGTRSSRQSKSETAAGKSTKSAAIERGNIFPYFMERKNAQLIADTTMQNKRRLRPAMAKTLPVISATRANHITQS